MGMQIKIQNNWTAIKNTFVKVNGSWTQSKAAMIKISGIWRKLWGYMNPRKVNQVSISNYFSTHWISNHNIFSDDNTFLLQVGLTGNDNHVYRVNSDLVVIQDFFEEFQYAWTPNSVVNTKDFIIISSSRDSDSYQPFVIRRKSDGGEQYRHGELFDGDDIIIYNPYTDKYGVYEKFMKQFREFNDYSSGNITTYQLEGIDEKYANPYGFVSNDNLVFNGSWNGNCVVYNIRTGKSIMGIAGRPDSLGCSIDQKYFAVAIGTTIHICNSSCSIIRTINTGQYWSTITDIDSDGNFIAFNGNGTVNEPTYIKKINVFDGVLWELNIGTENVGSRTITYLKNKDIIRVIDQGLQKFIDN